MSAKKHVIVAVTGATGQIYFLRTLRALLIGGHRVDLVMSKYGLVTLKEETTFGTFEGSFVDYLRTTFGEEAERGQLETHHYKDQTAPIASGSSAPDGMVVIPCTMKTLSGIAQGSSTNLIERAADVMLKERRRLVLVPREAPYNLVHLENMVKVTQAGGVILPASPAFYQRPETFDDLGDFIAGRIFQLFGLDHSLFARWQG